MCALAAHYIITSAEPEASQHRTSTTKHHHHTQHTELRQQTAREFEAFGGI